MAVMTSARTWRNNSCFGQGRAGITPWYVWWNINLRKQQRLRALGGVTRALIPVMAKTLCAMLLPFPYMAVALCVTSLAPLHTIFVIPHKLRTLSVFISFFCCVYHISLHMLGMQGFLFFYFFCKLSFSLQASPIPAKSSTWC